MAVTRLSPVSMTTRRACRKLWRRPHEDGADPSFTLCEPAEIRNRMRAAGSARIPSRHPRRRILCAATAWLQTPGSCVVPCERIEIRQSVAWVPADDPDQDGRISVTASEEVAVSVLPMPLIPPEHWRFGPLPVCRKSYRPCGKALLRGDQRSA